MFRHLLGEVHARLPSQDRHVGDLGNIEPDETGVAKGVIVDHLVKLQGEFSVIGRSFMVPAPKPSAV